MRLREEPALLEPMSIDVDVKQWQVPANQRGPRLLTEKRHQEGEMRRRIENMLNQKIIKTPKQGWVKIYFNIFFSKKKIINKYIF